MELIKTILDSKIQAFNKTQQLSKTKQKQRPRNLIWEAAEEFGRYVNLSTPFVMKLFKIYGQQKVLNLRSFLKDCKSDPKRYGGLVVWKLKQK